MLNASDIVQIQPFTIVYFMSFDIYMEHKTPNSSFRHQILFGTPPIKFLQFRILFGINKLNQITF